MKGTLLANTALFRGTSPQEAEAFFARMRFCIRAFLHPFCEIP